MVLEHMQHICTNAESCNGWPITQCGHMHNDWCIRVVGTGMLGGLLVVVGMRVHNQLTAPLQSTNLRLSLSMKCDSSIYLAYLHCTAHFCSHSLSAF